MTKAAGYYRVSSDEQAEKDLSIPAQQKAVHSAAAKDQMQLVAEFKDDGISAYSSADKRTGFCEMIARAKRKEFDVILVHKLDRFSRNRDESVLFKSLLKKHGVMVKSVTETHDPTTPQGFLYEGMIEVINQFYSMNLATETLKGMRENAGRGYRNGGTAPYGYEFKTVEIIGKNRKSILALGDINKVKVAQRIFDCYGNKGMGMGAIASMLNGEKVPGPTGGLWQKGAIRQILANRAYLGHTAWYQRKKLASGSRTGNDQTEWIVREDTHPPIIEKQLFDKCTQQRNGRSFFKNQRGENTRKAATYLLSGLIKCGHCGNNYTGKLHISKRRSGANRWYDYICSGYLRHGRSTCRHFTIEQQYIEDKILDLIKHYICTPGKIEQITKLAQEELDRLKSAFKQSAQNHQQRLARLDSQISNLVMAIANGSDPALINPKIDELKQEKALIISEGEKLESGQYYQEACKANIQKLTSLAGDLERIFASQPFEERRHIIQQFIEKIDVVEHKKLVIHFKVPFEMDGDKDIESGVYKNIVHPDQAETSAQWCNLAPQDTRIYEPQF